MPGTSLFKLKSIKARVTLFTLAIFVAGIWLLSFFMLEELRKDLEVQLGKQQATIASIVATEVNESLSTRLSLLENLAQRASSIISDDDNNKLQALLEDQLAINSDFNAGAFIVNKEGVAIAAVPTTIKRIGVSYINRDYVVSALAGKSSISRPVIGTVLHKPLFSFVVPIKDVQGKVYGALIAPVNLGSPNFIDKIFQNNYGKFGYLLIEDAKHRVVITGTDKSRIMQPLPAPGVNAMIDKQIQGFDGTVVATNPLGIKVLASTKRIPVTDWFIVAALPIKEAFSAIYQLQRQFILFATLITIASAGLTWWMLRRELAPMFATIKQLALLSNKGGTTKPLLIQAQNEIGELIAGFNHLLTVQAKRETELHTLLQSIAEGAYGVDNHGCCTFVNDSCLRMLGYQTADEMLGKHLHTLIHHSHADGSHYPATECRMYEAYRKNVAIHCADEVFWRKDGSSFPVEYWSQPIYEHGEIIGAIATFFDITVRKKMEEQIRQFALYDALTNLPNRRLLVDRMSQALMASKRTHQYGAVMFLDLDNFKSLNDQQGHEAGDKLLTEVAARLLACVREMDTVARLGGDEFVVMLTKLGTEQIGAQLEAEKIAEKIRTSLSAPYAVSVNNEDNTDLQIEHHCTVSVGVTLFEGDTASRDDIMRLADKAMYRAKEFGRNKVVFHV